MKYEIPDYVREMFDKATKFSKELKKVMVTKSTMEKLVELSEFTQREHKIITNEMMQFSEAIQRS